MCWIDLLICASIVRDYYQILVYHMYHIPVSLPQLIRMASLRNSTRRFFGEKCCEMNTVLEGYLGDFKFYVTVLKILSLQTHVQRKINDLFKGV